MNGPTREMLVNAGKRTLPTVQQKLATKASLAAKLAAPTAGASAAAMSSFPSAFASGTTKLVAVAVTAAAVVTIPIVASVMNATQIEPKVEHRSPVAQALSPNSVAVVEDVAVDGDAEDIADSRKPSDDDADVSAAPTEARSLPRSTSSEVRLMARDRSPAPKKIGRLSDELRLLDSAQIEIDAGRSLRGLEILEDYERTFRGGALEIEARALRTLALCALGRVDEAKNVARPLLDGSDHPARARIARSCVTSSD